MTSKIYQKQIDELFRRIGRVKDVAALLGISAPTLLSKKRGLTPWTVQDVLTLSQYSGVSPVEVFATLAEVPAPHTGSSTEYSTDYGELARVIIKELEKRRKLVFANWSEDG